ncbi:SubName: Full=Uncharacterized protein {ECO:0000313/EMBL:CCA71588.1} [Serendipita indica DSM 11827]|uniref:VOC domain-containing protein n=1 Tax=Serendipita indica (strain DSM 11827) TaxID=1109443 RepID=G4TJU1_SERID|nr:SubName: Full=Uncharacterized protein {ECO:0000313/EMBL:CCA71588.1} [Serendipita indica DSM 11827]CCA71588.1 hypothetical protein PIIN_05525 [Serendipita indica DSM 11827]
MGISHLGIYVKEGDLDKMTEWYLAVLAPLGYRLHKDIRPHAQVIGIGATYPDFWIATGLEQKDMPKQTLHIAFTASTRQQVRDFHALAMKLGAKDNGGPGLRPQYTSTYYGAFVFDPEGRNIEVHTILPEVWTEHRQRALLLGGVGALAAFGLSYFTSVGVYLRHLLL